MRVAYLTTEFVTEPNFYGGIAQYLGRLLPVMKRRGHDVEVFVPAVEGGETKHGGIPVHRVKPKRRVLVEVPLAVAARLTPGGLAGTRSILAKSRALSEALRARSREKSFDVVEAVSWMAMGYYAVQKPVAPTVIFAASYEPVWIAARGERMTPDLRGWCRLEREALRRASAVYAHSRFLEAEIRKGTGVRARVISPPFYADWTAEDKGALPRVADWPRFLLFFGKLCSYKGCGLLADAVAPLLDEMPDFRLLLVGKGPVDDAGKKLVDLATTRPDQVRHLGVLRPAQIMPLIRRSCGVALPSYVENMPNVCMETMWKGGVVIGPKGASFDELIHDGGSGVLFKLGDAASLRRAILRVWTLPPKKLAWIGKAAKTRVAALSPERTARELERFYASVMQT